MSNRHLARTIALQTLYQWDFNGCLNIDTSKEVKANLKQFAPQFDDQGFIENLVNNVLKNKKDIDTLITKYAPDWPTDSIDIFIINKYLYILLNRAII